MASDRTARLAVLGSSSQRAGSPIYPSRSGSPLRRRLVVGVLVLLSLVLITVYFRESNGGGLHRAQGVGATVLHPFEVAAERVARPFRDAYSWTAALFHAQSENDRLRAQVAEYRQLYIQGESAVAENARLRSLLRLQDAPTYPRDYRQVNTRIVVHAPSAFDQQVVVAAGAAQGVGLYDPVITSQGLVGKVTKVFSRASQVTLITDDTSAVSAVDLTTGARGLVRHGPGTGASLALDRVTKDQHVAEGDQIVTAGSQLGRLPSLYPPNIPIGRVTSVGESDTALTLQIQVEPAVDFSSLDSLAILVRRKPEPEAR